MILTVSFPNSVIVPAVFAAYAAATSVALPVISVTLAAFTAKLVFPSSEVKSIAAALPAWLFAPQAMPPIHPAAGREPVPRSNPTLPAASI